MACRSGNGKEHSRERKLNVLCQLKAILSYALRYACGYDSDDIARCDETLGNKYISNKLCLLRIFCWAFIFIIKSKSPPRSSVATVLKFSISNFHQL